MEHTSHLSNKDQISKLIRRRSLAEERKMLEHITPLVLRYGRTLWEIEIPYNIREVAFRWNPNYVREADMSKLTLLAVITTYHSCGYVGIFKPDLGEVLSQIPEHLVKQTCAFDVVYDSVVGDNIDDVDVFYGHKAFTKLYTHVAPPVTSTADEGFI